MPDLDPKLLEEQVNAAAQRIIAMRRHDHGYQGAVEVEDVIVVVAVRGADGRRYYADPAEITPIDKRCFLREYVRIGDRKGVSVRELVERFLPLVSPKAAGWLAWIKGLKR